MINEAVVETRVKNKISINDKNIKSEIEMFSSKSDYLKKYSKYKRSIYENFSELNRLGSNVLKIQDVVKSIKKNSSYMNLKIKVFVTLEFIIKLYSDTTVDTAFYNLYRIIIINNDCSEYIFDVTNENINYKYFENIVKNINVASSISKINEQCEINNIDISYFLLNSKSASVFVHELLGHTLEKDMIQNNCSPFDDTYIGKVVTNIESEYEIVNSMKSKKVKFGNFDDSGKLYEDKVLVKNGKICGFIESKRHSNFSRTPINRMYNTYLKTKDGINLEETCKTITNMILIDDIQSAGYNPINKTCFFECRNVKYIKNGYTQIIPIMTFWESASKLLLAIKQLGNDYEEHIGFCIKQDQEVIVVNGSPSILIDAKQMKTRISNENKY